MTSSAFGAAALIVLRSFSSDARTSSGVCAKYSSTFLAGTLLVFPFALIIVYPSQRSWRAHFESRAQRVNHLGRVCSSEHWARIPTSASEPEAQNAGKDYAPS